MSGAAPETLHASAVAVGGRGVLITGASGSGKSALALDLISRGAVLVADDGVSVRALPEGGGLWMSAPAAIAGQIEARGIGILRLPATEARAAAVVTLDDTETARLPEARDIVIAGVTLPLFAKVESPAFPAMLLAYLSGERIAP